MQDEIFLKVKVTGSYSCEIWLHAKSMGSDTVNGSEWNFWYYEFTLPLQEVTEPESFISSQDQVTWEPNLDYLPNHQNEVYFLGHGLSNADETWFVGRGLWVVHDSITLTLIED